MACQCHLELAYVSICQHGYISSRQHMSTHQSTHVNTPVNIYQHTSPPRACVNKSAADGTGVADSTALNRWLIIHPSSATPRRSSDIVQHSTFDVHRSSAMGHLSERFIGHRSTFIGHRSSFWNVHRYKLVSRCGWPVGKSAAIVN